MGKTSSKTRKNVTTNLPRESLENIFSRLPREDLFRNVTLVCNEWWNIARYLQTSLTIAINLGDKRRKRITCKKLAGLLAKTTRLKTLLVKTEVHSKYGFNFSSMFYKILFLQKENLEILRSTLPKSLTRLTLSFENTSYSGRLVTDGPVMAKFREIAYVLKFHIETVSFEERMVLVRFCNTENDFQNKLMDLTIESLYNHERLDEVLENCGDDFQQIYLHCNLSEKAIEKMKTLSSLKKLSLMRVQGDCKSLFDESSKLKQLECLELEGFDVGAVRNMVNCCQNGLKELDITFSNRRVDHLVAGEWVNNLKKLKCLRKCIFASLLMPPECWASLFDQESQLQTLNSLEICGANTLDERAFSNLAKLCWQSLKRLEIYDLSDMECAKEIRKLSALEELQISFNILVSSTGFVGDLFSSKSQLSHLKMLNIWCREGCLDETSVGNLVKCCGKTLEKLDLLFDNREEMQDECLSHLKHLSNLKVLSLEAHSYQGNDFSSAAWTSLFDEESELKNLTDMTLYKFKNINDCCLENLAKLCGQNVNEVDIKDCGKLINAHWG